MVHRILASPLKRRGDSGCSKGVSGSERRLFQSGGERTDRISRSVSGLGITDGSKTVVSGETYPNEVNHRRSVTKDTGRYFHNVGYEIPFRSQSSRRCVADPPKDEIGEGLAGRFSRPEVEKCRQRGNASCIAANTFPTANLENTKGCVS